jgi:hypothetical protein
MTCEFITVTNTLSNGICSGTYQKTPDILEWIQENNPTCRVQKIWNASDNKWQWVFRVVVPPGADPPPGSQKAILYNAPATFTANLNTFQGDFQTQESSLIYSNTVSDGEFKLIDYTPQPGSTATVNIQGYFSPDLVSISTSEIKTGSNIYPNLNWKWLSGDNNFQSEIKSITFLQNFSNFDEGKTDSENAQTLYEARVFKLYEEIFRFDVGPGFSSVLNHNFTDSGITTNYQFSVQASANWITNVWLVEDMYSWESGSSWWDLFDRNNGLGDWSAGYILPTEIFTDTTENETCPANSDWNATGLTVSTGADPGNGDEDGDGDGDVNPPEKSPTDLTPVIVQPEGNPANLTPVIVQPAGSPADLTSDIVDDGDGDGGGGGTGVDPGDGDGDGDGDGGNGADPDNDQDDPGGDDDPDVDPEDPDDDGGPDTDGDENDVTEPVVGPVNLSSAFVECSVPTRYKGFVFDPRTSSLSGPFVSQDITAVTTKDNSSEMYAVNSENQILRTVVTELNNTSYAKAEDPFTDLTTPLTKNGVVMSKSGKGFSYRNRYKAEPFVESIIGCGPVEDPLYFKDAYLSIAETNWIHLGDEHNEKQIHRVDIRFHKNSVGHLFLYVQNDDGKVKGQYKGAIKEHVKVFTNLRARGIQVCMMIVAHKDYPWAMREMAIGHLYGKSF